MLREQRLALVNGDIYNENTIEQLYFESMNAFDDVDFYTEGVGDAVERAFDKLKDLVDKILTAIKEFFGKFRKEIKQTEIDPNAEVDEKELSKLQKFLKTCKKVISMPFEKLAALVKAHKKGAAAAAIIAAISAFSIGAIVTKKKNDKIREHNAKVRKANAQTAREINAYNRKMEQNAATYNQMASEYNHKIDGYNKNAATPDAKKFGEAYKKEQAASAAIKRNAKKEQELAKTLQETESLCRDLETRIEHIKKSNKKHQRFGKSKKELKAAQAKAAGLRDQISATQARRAKAEQYLDNARETRDYMGKHGHRPIADSKKVDYRSPSGKVAMLQMEETPLIQNFYTMLAGKLSQASNALQSGMTKMRRPAKAA